MKHDFLILLAGLICINIGIELAYLERGYFARGSENIFIFIPLAGTYIKTTLKKIKKNLHKSCNSVDSLKLDISLRDIFILPQKGDKDNE